MSENRYGWTFCGPFGLSVSCAQPVEAVSDRLREPVSGLGPVAAHFVGELSTPRLGEPVLDTQVMTMVGEHAPSHTVKPQSGSATSPRPNCSSDSSPASSRYAFIRARFLSPRRRGLVATLTTLAVFYAWVVATGGLYGGSAFIVAEKYSAGGMICGPLFGLLGGLQARTKSRLPAVPFAAAFALEPLAWTAHGAARPMPALIPILQVSASGVTLAAAGWRMSTAGSTTPIDRSA